MNPLNEYYLRQPEPEQSMLLFLRRYLLESDPDISETLSFGLPFFKYRGKMLCYFNYHKKYRQYYVSFSKSADLAHPELLLENRKMFRILLLDSERDLPMELIENVLESIKPLISR